MCLYGKDYLIQQVKDKIIADGTLVSNINTPTFSNTAVAKIETEIAPITEISNRYGRMMSTTAIYLGSDDTFITGILPKFDFKADGGWTEYTALSHIVQFSYTNYLDFFNDTRIGGDILLTDSIKYTDTDGTSMSPLHPNMWAMCEDMQFGDNGSYPTCDGREHRALIWDVIAGDVANKVRYFDGWFDIVTSEGYAYAEILDDALKIMDAAEITIIPATINLWAGALTDASHFVGYLKWGTR